MAQELLSILAELGHDLQLTSHCEQCCAVVYESRHVMYTAHLPAYSALDTLEEHCFVLVLEC